MKVSKDFDIREFVPEEIWNKFGANSIWFIDKRCIEFAQWVRDLTGKSVTINNWHTGGQYKDSGYRMPDTETGALFSQHKLGNAIDIKIDGFSGEQLRDLMAKNKQQFLKYMTTIELGTKTWLHVDCRQTNLDDIYLVPFR